jgi:hypothetical protein
MEKIIELHAKKLKEEVGTALNYDECFDLIEDAVNEALNQGQTLPIDSVSHRRELLPEFLMHDLDGKIITSFIGGADVTKEWNEYLGNFG